VEEFRNHGWDTSEMLDPQDPDAYYSAKLDWDELSVARHREMLDFYGALIRLRREHAELSDPRLDRALVSFDEDEGWFVLHRGSLRVIANFSDSDRVISQRCHEILLSSDASCSIVEDSVHLGAHSAIVAR
jgi:maltooligosyltrehalose trehalohydrolase